MAQPTKSRPSTFCVECQNEHYYHILSNLRVVLRKVMGTKLSKLLWFRYELVKRSLLILLGSSATTPLDSEAPSKRILVGRRAHAHALAPRRKINIGRKMETVTMIWSFTKIGTWSESCFFSWKTKRSFIPCTKLDMTPRRNWFQASHG